MKYIRNKSPKAYMLKGLLRCGACGATLTLLSTASPSLQCHRYARGQCHVSHSITVKKADALAISALEDIVLSRRYTFEPPKPAKLKVAHDWDKLISAEELKLSRARSAMLDGVSRRRNTRRQGRRSRKLSPVSARARRRRSRRSQRR